MPGLSQFTIDELLEEIQRRRNDEETREPIKNCDLCRHFNTYTGPLSQDISKDWQGCKLGHKQSLRLPASPTDIDYGLYRRVCPDRQAIS